MQYCSGCQCNFASLGAFDCHRFGAFATPGKWKGDRRCLDRAEMSQKLRPDGLPLFDLSAPVVGLYKTDEEKQRLSDLAK